MLSEASFLHSEDTICALATPDGQGGISVLRVSGDKAYSLVRRLCPFLKDHPESHKVYYGFLQSLKKEALDEVLITYFAKGRSFTAEEVVEISCHGGYVVSRLILKELLKSGCRLARPGEFTLRAFLNQKIDLVQAESIQLLVSSGTKTLAHQALLQLKGNLSSQIQDMEEVLVKALAHIEARIDFSEEDIDPHGALEIRDLLKATEAQLQKLLSSYEQGKVLKKGLKVALLGQPNVGKSSLFNSFLDKDRALVSTLPGTTRDFLVEEKKQKNIVIRFVDTAGLRVTQDSVEKEGIEKTRQVAEESDVIFYVLDATKPVDFEDISEIQKLDLKKLFLLMNKTDLKEPTFKTLTVKKKTLFFHPVSARTKKGLLEILEKVYQAAAGEELLERNKSLIVEHRHFELLSKAQKHISYAVQRWDQDEGILAVEISEALSCFYELLGKRFDEQVLDKIFQEFCLGK